METQTPTETLSHYYKYIKPRLETDPEYKAKWQAYQNKRRSVRYQEDPEFRAKRDALTQAFNKKKYHENEEFRQRKKDQALQRYYRLKALKSASAS